MAVATLVRHPDGSHEVPAIAQSPICASDYLQRCSDSRKDICCSVLAEVCDEESISMVFARLERVFDGLHADMYGNVR
jgi:hypothetical protein